MRSAILRALGLRLTGLTAWPAALLCVGSMAGCPAPCTDLCAKLDRCELSGSVSHDECTDACSTRLDELQQGKQATTDNEAEQAKRDEDRKAFLQHRICLTQHSCDELAAGACYDERLFPIGAP